jgi:hypothetical protein
MIDRARLAAILVVLTAAAGTAYELSSGDAADPRRAPPPRPPPAAAVSHAGAVAQWQADILARPLIYPGRRAPLPGVVAEAAPAPEPVPRLTGVIVGPAGRSALFVAGQGARPTTVHEGAHIGPYTIRSIRANEVVVDGPGGTSALHPSYEGAPQPSGPPPSPPAKRA